MALIDSLSDPALFVAVNVYVPASRRAKFLISNVPSAVIRIRLLLCTAVPSLSHVYDGVGVPRAEPRNRNVCLGETRISERDTSAETELPSIVGGRSGCLVKTGAFVARANLLRK